MDQMMQNEAVVRVIEAVRKLKDALMNFFNSIAEVLMDFYSVGVKICMRLLDIITGDDKWKRQKRLIPNNVRRRYGEPMVRRRAYLRNLQNMRKHK